MSLQFFNSDRADRAGKQYLKPIEILTDPYLTPLQKHIVLESMLADVTDEQGCVLKASLKLAEEITKAQSSLKTQMD